MWRKPVGRRSHADADAHLASSVVACSSAPTSPPQAASRRRSTASRRSAATRCRSSRRARACGGRRPTRPRRWRASGSAARRPGSAPCSCHALYLVNLASRDDEIRAKSLESLRATMETAQAIGAEAVVFHVGSHLGYGFDEALEVVAPALRAGARAARPTTSGSAWRTRPAPAARSAARSTSSRRSATRSTATRGSGSASTRATGGRRASTSPIPIALDDAVSRARRADRARARPRAPRQRRRRAPSARTATVTSASASALIGDGLATFLGHPAFQRLPAVTETWEDEGAETKDLGELRRLYREGAPEVA